jgi:mannan endo-1,4-beta-mannosidase
MTGVLLTVVTCAQEQSPCAKIAGPADQRASLQVHAVLDYFNGLPSRTDKRLVSGQFMGWFPVASLATANEIQLQTGQWVGIAGFDYYETYLNMPKTQPALFKPPRWKAINEFAKTYWEMGGLVTISCHMTNPWDGGLAWGKAARFEDLLSTNTTAHARYMEQVDEVARGLADLQDAGVVVLFRPFHEMQGDWFWWGGRNPDVFRKVWINLFEYYTQKKRLHNLIWIWSPNGNSPALEYYPGTPYVDMTGLDIYSRTLKEFKSAYEALKKTGKPFAITEFGPSAGPVDAASFRAFDYGPFARQIAEHLPDTVFFLTWRDEKGLLRNLNARALLHDPLVVNRDGLDFTNTPLSIKSK